MLLIESSVFVDSLLIFILAFLIDVFFGEFPERFHPTVGIGKVIAFFKPKFKSGNPRREKVNGIFLCVLVILIVAVPVGLLLWGIRLFAGRVPYIVVSAIFAGNHLCNQVHEAVHRSNSRGVEEQGHR